MIKTRCFLALSAGILMSACDNSGSSNLSATSQTDGEISLTRETVSGPIRGELAGEVLRFLGIPYAQPPTGTNRFAPPKPPTSWSETKDTTQYAASCPQSRSAISEASSTEDCLFLNVFTPNSEGEFPVMVWLHGGAFLRGSGSEPYNPARLVERGVVVVTLNYRLGLAGWMSHPELTAEGEGSSGNYGLMDQQAALQWVQANIANFGGDPDNITLFGESAGGHSVLTHMAAPDSEGLFQKAIVQSGSYFPEQNSLADSETIGLAVETAAGCESVTDTLGCLRNLPIDELLSIQDGLNLGIGLVPTTSTEALPASISDAISGGSFNKVPTILGFNQNEGRYFIGIAGLAGLPEEGYETAIGQLLGLESAPNSVTQAIANEYPTSEYETPAYALSAVFTDAVFVCNALDQSSKLVTSPLHSYEFADVTAPSILPPIEGFDFAAAHAFELSYLFGDDAFVQALGFTQDQLNLSENMLNYWTAFASNSDPNPESGDALFWPHLAASGKSVRFTPDSIQLDSTSSIATRHHCDFWSSF